MSKRSLRASEQGIQEAKRAFNCTGLTQQQLANEVNCKSRQPIWKFFRGQPIESQIFLNICDFLELDLQDIVAWQPEQTHNHTSINWKFRQWWENNSQKWIEKLKLLMVEYRNIGHSWLFNKQQQKLLQQYYDANKLLVDCLNSDCYVSREVRQEIEESLLLPKF